MPPIPIPRGTGPAVSIAEELIRAAQMHSPVPDLATEESIRAALHNFLANNIQNRTIPLATQNIQDAIDNLGLDLLRNFNEHNPRLLDLVFGGRKLPDTPNPIQDVIASGGAYERRAEDFGSFNDIGSMIGGGRESLDELTADEAQAVARVLAGAQDSIRKARQNPELLEMMPDMEQMAETIPGARYTDSLSQLENTVGALQFNNNFRQVGPLNAGDVRNDFMRTGDDPAKYPLIRAVESLELAGVPIPVIYGHLLDVLREMDTWIRASSVAGTARSESGGTYSTLMDPAAIVREQSTQDPGGWPDFGWPPGTEGFAEGAPGLGGAERGDPTTILRALGLDRR